MIDEYIKMSEINRRERNKLSFSNMDMFEYFSLHEDNVFDVPQLVVGKDVEDTLIKKMEKIDGDLYGAIEELSKSINPSRDDLIANTEEHGETGEKLGVEYHRIKNFILYDNNKGKYALKFNQYLLEQILKTGRIGEEQKAKIKSLNMSDPKSIYELEKIILLHNEDNGSLVRFYNKISREMHEINHILEVSNDIVYDEYAKTYKEDIVDSNEYLDSLGFSREDLLNLKKIMPEEHSGELLVSFLEKKKLEKENSNDILDKEIDKILNKLKKSDNVSTVGEIKNRIQQAEELILFNAAHENSMRAAKSIVSKLFENNQASPNSLLFSVDEDGVFDVENLSSRLYGGIDAIARKNTNLMLDKKDVKKINNMVIGYIKSPEFKKYLSDFEKSERGNVEILFKFHDSNIKHANAIRDMIYKELLQQQLAVGYGKDYSGDNVVRDLSEVNRYFKSINEGEGLDIVYKLNEGHYNLKYGKSRTISRDEMLDRVNNITNIIKVLDLVNNNHIDKQTAINIIDSPLFDFLGKDSRDGLKTFANMGFKHKEYDNYSKVFSVDPDEAINIQDVLKMEYADAIYKEQKKMFNIVGIFGRNRKMIKQLATCLKDSQNPNINKYSSTGAMVTNCLKEYENNLERNLSELGEQLNRVNGNLFSALSGVGILLQIREMNQYDSLLHTVRARYIMEDEIGEKIMFLDASENSLDRNARESIIMANTDEFDFSMDENSKEKDAVKTVFKDVNYGISFKIIREDAFEEFEKKVHEENLKFVVLQGGKNTVKDVIEQFRKSVNPLKRWSFDFESKINREFKNLTEKNLAVKNEIDKELIELGGILGVKDTNNTNIFDIAAKEAKILKDKLERDYSDLSKEEIEEIKKELGVAKDRYLLIINKMEEIGKLLESNNITGVDFSNLSASLSNLNIRANAHIRQSALNKVYLNGIKELSFRGADYLAIRYVIESVKIKSLNNLGLALSKGLDKKNEDGIKEIEKITGIKINDNWDNIDKVIEVVKKRDFDNLSYSQINDIDKAMKILSKIERLSKGNYKDKASEKYMEDFESIMDELDDEQRKLLKKSSTVDVRVIKTKNHKASVSVLKSNISHKIEKAYHDYGDRIIDLKTIMRKRNSKSENRMVDKTVQNKTKYDKSMKDVNYAESRRSINRHNFI